MKNILTFDVEEHFQVEAFYDIIPRSSWDQRQSRLTMNMIKLFDILEAHQARATFFVLGWIADRYPQLISMIVDKGHELASHGYGHDSLKRLCKSEFEVDLQKSIESLGRASGMRVRGYRAPTFSADRKNEWIWETMISNGIEYDSSIFPIVHDLYGDPSAPRFPYYINSSKGKIFEIPPTTYRFLGKHLPACGGGSFRIFPYWYTRRAIKAYNKEGYPAMVYIHPWEIDANQPVEKSASTKSRLRHYTNLHTVERKLRRLLSDFQFGSVRDVFAERLSANVPFHKQQYNQL
jgi:polysaccharide deacetylase family protein (PEP-CTERM system associated)